MLECEQSAVKRHAIRRNTRSIAAMTNSLRLAVSIEHIDCLAITSPYCQETFDGEDDSCHSSPVYDQKEWLSKRDRHAMLRNRDPC